MSAVPSIKKLTFTHTAELLLENVTEKEMVFHKICFSILLPLTRSPMKSA